MSVVNLLLDNRFVTQFPEHTWSKVDAQKNAEIVEILLKLDLRFQVTENVLKHAVKSSNVKTLKLLLTRDPKIKITQRVVERAAKRKDAEILKLFVDHMPDKERLNVPEGYWSGRTTIWKSWRLFLSNGRASRSARMFSNVRQRNSTYEFWICSWRNFQTSDSLPTFWLLPQNTQSGSLSGQSWNTLKNNPYCLPMKLLRPLLRDLAPPDPPGPPPGPPSMPHPPPPRLGSPNLGMVKLVLDANKDCLTENALQSAFRLDTADIETFKFLF